jgi:hypothetical protein
MREADDATMNTSNLERPRDGVAVAQVNPLVFQGRENDEKPVEAENSALRDPADNVLWLLMPIGLGIFVVVVALILPAG